MEEVFRGRRFRVLSGEVVLPSGKTVRRDIVDFGESVVILPLLDGRVVMIKQFRAAVGDWLYELPAGVVEPGEDPAETARRELIEETGYEAGGLVRMFGMYLSPGYSNEFMHAYLATDLRYVGARPEYGEEIRIVSFGLEEVLGMIREGVIRDAKTIATILFYLHFDGGGSAVG